METVGQCYQCLLLENKEKCYWCKNYPNWGQDEVSDDRDGSTDNSLQWCMDSSTDDSLEWCMDSSTDDSLEVHYDSDELEEEMDKLLKSIFVKERSPYASPAVSHEVFLEPPASPAVSHEVFLEPPASPPPGIMHSHKDCRCCCCCCYCDCCDNERKCVDCFVQAYSGYDGDDEEEEEDF